MVTSNPKKVYTKRTVIYNLQITKGLAFYQFGRG